jgi:Ser/Thr protein kinase RdoA (MazF antagonist)
MSTRGDSTSSRELLQHAPRYDLAEAARLARDLFAIDGSASPLPSERDQNFVIATAAGERYVLKVANAAEERAMLEAQNAAMTHLESRVTFCPRVRPTRAGSRIGVTPDGAHLVRLVTYLPGTPLARTGGRTADLLESLGRTVGRLDAALADFDHPAVHRGFHWDLAQAERVIADHLPLVDPIADRQLVERASAAAVGTVGPLRNGLRRSIVHHDANDWNVLVDGERVVGIIDFGDMVHSWTVADPAVAAAYAMLDGEDPLVTTETIVRGYSVEQTLTDDELAAVFPLACLRLCMSVCIAAWQQRQRPDDDYLAVSQAPIRRTLPRVAGILSKAGWAGSAG